MKAVLVVGKTGLGKSTFCNALTGSNHRANRSMLAVTREPIEALASINQVKYKAIDFPGTGDVVAQNHTPLTDDEIYAMIAQKAAVYDVVAVVVFVSQDDVLGARLSSQFLGLVSTIKNRFRGFESVVYFAISGPSMPGDAREFMTEATRQFRSGKFDVTSSIKLESMQKQGFWWSNCLLSCQAPSPATCVPCP
ncbi:UNVERIFIED_CONTAM: hypothetical protein HDU68_006722 [Siphonaria sp. JEL0065]|nr:hypothetical protein HDU68_006722 [Siphonaria sp. JEL0065]